MDNKLKHNIDNNHIINTFVKKNESLWSYVNCYDDLLNLNLDFIHDKLSTTPYHFGPLEEPSNALIQNLDYKTANYF